MTNAKDIPFAQIQNWIMTESAKKRPMKDIVDELSTRDDVTVLSAHDRAEIRNQKIVDSITKVT